MSKKKKKWAQSDKKIKFTTQHSQVLQIEMYLQIYTMVQHKFKITIYNL